MYHDRKKHPPEEGGNTVVRSSTGKRRKPPHGLTISERLERVREKTGLDYRAFHGRVRAAAEDLNERIPSYAAVLTYHVNRPPPVSYLVAVSHAFHVPLRWLARGVGPDSEIDEVMAAPPDLESPEWAAVRRAFRVMRSIEADLPLPREFFYHEPARAALEDVGLELLLSGSHRDNQLSDREIEAIVRDLAWAWMVPLWAVRPDPRTLKHRELRAYFFAIYQAISVVMPDPGEGDPRRAARFLRTLRRALERGTADLDEREKSEG